MMKGLSPQAIAVLFLVLLSFSYSEQQVSSQQRLLLRAKRLLNYPAVLREWNISSNFCDLEPQSSLTIVCYKGRITQLQIIGDSASILPANFSLNSLITTLVGLPDLKVLTLNSLGLWGTLPGKVKRFPSLEMLNMSSNFLSGALPVELSYMSNLQTLVLDNNGFEDELPMWIGSLSGLSVLSLRNNRLNGSLPNSLSAMTNLRVLALSYNQFQGNVTSFSGFINLEVLDLEGNAFGPEFPLLENGLVTLKLANNKFRASLPPDITTFYQLEWFDVSNNNLIGPFPMAVLSLPSISYINISNNLFSGKMYGNQTCGPQLELVDVSSNRLIGNLPKCFSQDKTDVFYSRNCLQTRNGEQHPFSFCNNEALAVGLLPLKRNRTRPGKAKLALCIVAGVVGGGIALAAILFLIHRRSQSRRRINDRPPKIITENASRGYHSKMLLDARYVAQSLKLETLGLPAYQTFTLEELEEATNNFDPSLYMREGAQRQMYRGRLKDGSLVTVECVMIEKSQNKQDVMHYIELISKLRHQHLVSALGHCLECYSDDSTANRMFLVFESAPNGELRSLISEGVKRTGQQLSWAQRISVAIGVAKGIQFLHTGIVPGLYSNNLKITDILLDQNLVAKISCSNLPITDKLQSCREVNSGGFKGHSFGSRSIQDEESDISDFGVILLEMIVGRPITSVSEVNKLSEQLHGSISGDENSRRLFPDASLNHRYSAQSLKTVMEICAKCLDGTSRPSIEDVIWNLQFAAQVQDAWQGEHRSSEGSPRFQPCVQLPASP